MPWSEVTLIVVATVLILGWIAWSFAQRIDRLHRKVVGSRMALDAQLVRRAVIAGEFASTGSLDPASALLVLEASFDLISGTDTAEYELVTAVPDIAALLRPRDEGRTPSRADVSRALNDGLGDARVQAENALSATMAEALSDDAFVCELYENPEAKAQLDDLAGAWYRVQLARRFHNESVDQARQLRHNWWVRLLHLAGRAAMPSTVDLNDTWPSGLRPVVGVAG